MKTLTSLLTISTFLLSVGLVYAQDTAKDYKNGIEDLTNGLYTEAMVNLKKALNDAQPDDPELSKIRYALGYAYSKAGQISNAIQVLDELVAKDPFHDNGRYLLGISLMQNVIKADVDRGMEVLDQLSRENTEETVRSISMHMAARFAHIHSTIHYATGEPDAALFRLSDLLRRFGTRPAPTKKENQNIRFSSGVYLMATDDLDGAQFELDYLALKAKSFKLNNGITLTEIRGNLYYQAALKQIQAGEEAGGKNALTLVEASEKLGEGNEAANQHLKALAYGLTGDKAKEAEAIAAVTAANPEYAARMQLNPPPVAN